MNLWLDLETRSRIDLRKSGARRYAADPSTCITVAAWCFGGGTVKTACPLGIAKTTHTVDDLYADIEKCTRIVAHNANFDVNVLRGPSQRPFINLPLQKISCTMARAQALSLPGGLDALCIALNVKGKDERGKFLVMKTCKPQRDGEFCEDREIFQELLEYNVQDVHCLMSVDKLLPELNENERTIWERTWRKNNVGLPIDIELATAIAARRTEIEFETANTLREITGNAVTKITQRQRILAWLETEKVVLPDTQKHTVDEALEDPELPAGPREVLELLESAGGSAPTKAQAILDRHVCGSYKDATRYFGARSGRGTSEGANLFNIARPSGKYDVEKVIEGLKRGEKFNNTALTDALRGCIVAPAGYALIDADEKQAELRFALWQAGDTERLEILSDPESDLYMVNAIRLFNLPSDATKKTHPKERQTAKNVTLGGNYQLGWVKYLAFLRRTVADSGLLRTQITPAKAKADIDGYRGTNPKLVTLWGSLKAAWENCYYDPPGNYYYAGKIKLMKDGDNIWMVLPSGRAIPHYSCHVGQDGNYYFWRAKHGAMRPQKVFGGSLLEISCQAMTRDLITEVEKDIENELTDTILLLDVYDSVVALAPAEVAEQRHQQIGAIMTRQRSWTAGLPLGEEGYVAQRMKK